MEKELVNKVANSRLKTINLEDFYPLEAIVELDIKDYLFKGLLLKEMDFRKFLKEENWSQYQGKRVCLFCSTDAIVPVWSYMLIVKYLKGIAMDVFLGKPAIYLESFYRDGIRKKDWSEYDGQMIIVKGCSSKPVPASAYMELTQSLLPFAKSIMYGEPCSTVPIYKKPR